MVGLSGVALIFNHAAVVVLIAVEWAVARFVSLPGAYVDVAFRSTSLGYGVFALVLATMLWGYARGWTGKTAPLWLPFAVTVAALVLTARGRLNRRTMKSAYELAMERLSKSDPAAGKPLSAEKKARLGEINTVYKGKIAEREIFLKKQLDEAYAAGNLDEIGKIRAQLGSERARLEEEREEEKERVRRGK